MTLLNNALMNGSGWETGVRKTTLKKKVRQIMYKTRRPRVRRWELSEAEKMAIPEEQTIKPITKGEDCIPITINDIFARRNEAELIAKMMGKEVEFSDIFDKLINDITLRNGHRYRYSDDIRQGWAMTLDEFMALAAFYKSLFNNCTRDGMKLLLLQTRRAALQLKKQDPKRFKRREYKKDGASRGGYYHGVSKMHTLDCADKTRVTPLPDSVYDSFFGIVVCKRLGAIANNTLTLRVDIDSVYGDSVTPRIERSRIVLVVNQQIVTGSNWTKAIREKKEIKSPSVLTSLRKEEKLVAKKIGGK